MGTAIGLLVAQPWKPLSRLAPVGVRVTAHSATSAVVAWHQAPGSREPGSWVVFRNSAKYATVPSGRSSFADSQLVPGGAYTYRIAEASGSAQSLESGVATVTTEAPSVQNLRQTAADTCGEGLHANFQPPGELIGNTPFTVALKLSGGDYVGTTKAQIFACGGQFSGPGTNDTVNVDISPVRASGGVWSTFTGTVEVTMPYSPYSESLGLVSTTMYCPAQTWTFTVGGSR